MSETRVNVPCAHSMDDQEACFATQCPLCLANEVERLKEALKVSMRALDDWLHIHAPEMCDDAKVNESKERIAQTGTLAYIALVQQGNRKALGVEERTMKKLLLPLVFAIAGAVFVAVALGRLQHLSGQLATIRSGSTVAVDSRRSTE